MASYNTSLINTTNTGLLSPQEANRKSQDLLSRSRTDAFTKGIKTSLSATPDFDSKSVDEALDKAADYRFSSEFNNALSRQSQKYNEIAEYYKNFYVNGIAYDKDGNPIQGADATSYADRYEFAEFLHELYPELSVSYFMKNADSFIYRATGVKADVKSYGEHLSNIWNASWKNAGDSIWTVLQYMGGALSNGFDSVGWQNTKKEMAKRRSLNGSNYRKDLGDEKYDSLWQKMLSGTVEQSPQMAMMAMMMITSLATGGISGAGGIAGKLALGNMAKAKAAGNVGRMVMNGVNFAVSGLMDAGSFMNELSEAGASDEAAFIAGLGILASTGFLETWGDDTLLSPVDKVANFLFKKRDTQVINQAVKSAGKIFREKAWNVAMDIGASEITETVQEEVEYIAEVLAKEIVVSFEAKYGNMLNREELGLTEEQIAESLHETMIQTMLSTPLMTLGSNILSTGIDVGFGELSTQWSPKRYMNKEGATNVRGSKEFANFGLDIVDPNMKDGDNGKPNPIKAHTVGSYTFIDGKISQAQYDLIMGDNKNKGIFTQESASKVTKRDVSTLESYSTNTDVVLKPEVADSYLAAIEMNGNLEEYGYETKGKVTDQYNENSSSLYITLKDTGETIKINLGEKNSSNEKLNGLKDFTNVEFRTTEDLEHVDVTKEEIDKAKARQEKREQKRKEKEEQQKREEEAKKTSKTDKEQNENNEVKVNGEDGSPESPEVSQEDTDDWDPFAGTSKQGQKPSVTTNNDTVRKNNNEKIKASTIKDFKDSHKSSVTTTKDGKKTKTTVTPFAKTHGYTTASGAKETADVHNAKYIEFYDADGNVIDRVDIEKASNATIKDLLSYSEDNGKDSLDSQTKTPKKQYEKKNDAYNDAGVIPNSTDPVQKVGEVKQQEETKAAEPENTNDSTETTNETQNEEKPVSEATDDGQKVENDKHEEVADTKDEKPEVKSEEKKESKPQVTPVTAKEVDDLARSYEQKYKLSQDRGRQMALLAKGLKDLSEFIDKPITYENAGKTLDFRIFAESKTLQNLLGTYIDTVLAHPVGKELFKVCNENARNTSANRAVFKEQIMNYLKGNTTELSETAINNIDQLYGPIKGAINIAESISEEDKRIAEQLERDKKEAEKEEKKTEEKAKNDAEKKLEKKKTNYTNEARNNAFLAQTYCEQQAEYFTNNAAKDKAKEDSLLETADKWKSLAKRFAKYHENIVKNGYQAALEFYNSYDARTVMIWAAKGKIVNYKNSKGEDKKGKIARTISSDEIALEQAKAAFDYYNQIRDLQVRRVGETGYLGVSGYELSKIDLALNEKLSNEVEKIINEVVSGKPKLAEINESDFYYFNDDGKIIVETVNGKPRAKINKEEYTKALKNARENYVLDLYEYLDAVIEAGTADAVERFVTNVNEMKLNGVMTEVDETDKDGKPIMVKVEDENGNPVLDENGKPKMETKKVNRFQSDVKTKESAHVVSEDMKPIIAFYLRNELLNTIGYAGTAINKLRNKEIQLSDIEKVFTEFADYADILIDARNDKSMLYMNYATYQQRSMEKAANITEDDLKNEFVGVKAAQRVDNEYTFYDDYKKAVQLRDAGTPIEEVWRQTGWFWGVDGKWRMEVTEDYMTSSPFLSKLEEDLTQFIKDLSKKGKSGEAVIKTFTTSYKDIPISRFLGEGNFLLEAYPELNKVYVSFYYDIDDNFKGYYSDEWKSIKINLATHDFDWQSGLSAEYELLHTITHELQHAIQLIEGFAKGGNKRSAQNAVDIFYKNERESLQKYSREGLKLTTVEYDLANNRQSSSTLKELVAHRFKKEWKINFASNIQEVRDFFKDPLLNTPVRKLSDADIASIKSKKDSVAARLKEVYETDESLSDAKRVFNIDEETVLSGRASNDLAYTNSFDFYHRLQGEVEARNAADRWRLDEYDKFPLSTQDTYSKYQLVVNPFTWKGVDMALASDSEVLKYEHEGISNELSASPFKHTKGRDIDYLNYKSSFEFDNDTGRYYINANNVYNEILTVMTATYPEGAEVDMPALRQKAKLASIFISSLSEDAQDAIVRRSTDKAHNNGKLLTGTNEALLRLFFTPDELNGIKMSDRTKGATFSDWSKIFLTTMSDENTVTHEIGHILFTLDSSFRERAVKEYKEYFEKDKDGESIRAVVSANPENFGGMSADAVIKALHRLTEDDYDFNQKSDLNTEEAVQYMFQTWWQGKDTLDYAKGVKGLFEKVAAYIKKVAERIMNFFGVDILHETNNKVFSPLFTNAEKAQEFMNDMKMKDVDFHQFDRPEAKTLTVSQYGNIRILDVDNKLVLTHGISYENYEKSLQNGGKLPAPSLAIGNANRSPKYGDGANSIAFIGNRNLAERFIEKGYAGYVMTGYYPLVKYIDKKHRFGSTPDTMKRNINLASSGVRNFFDFLNDAVEGISYMVEHGLSDRDISEVHEAFTPLLKIGESYNDSSALSFAKRVNLLDSTVNEINNYLADPNNRESLDIISNVLSETTKVGQDERSATLHDAVERLEIANQFVNFKEGEYLIEDSTYDGIATSSNGYFLTETPENVVEIIKNRLSNNAFYSREDFDSIRKKNIFTEIKPTEVVDFSDFSAVLVLSRDKDFIESLRKELEPFGLSVFSYSDSLTYNAALESYTSSVKGAADQLLFQTVGSVAQELAADSQSAEKKTNLVHDYEGLMYRHVTQDISGNGESKQIIADWRKAKQDFMVTSDEIDSLRKKLEATGIFHNVDIQNNLSSTMKEKIKDDVTKRIAYKDEGYASWAKRIAGLRDDLTYEDDDKSKKKAYSAGDYRAEDSVQVKKALYALYGYREVKGKSASGKTTTKTEATGLLSRVFAVDKRNGSKWTEGPYDNTIMVSLRNDILKRAAVLDSKYTKLQQKAQEAQDKIKTLTEQHKEAEAAKDTAQVQKLEYDIKAANKEYEAYKMYEGYDGFLGTLGREELDGFFLNKKIWNASRTQELTNVLKQNSNEYSTLNFTFLKNNDVDVMVKDLKALLTVLVDLEGKPFIYTDKEFMNISNEGESARILSGPLVDLINYAHLDESEKGTFITKGSTKNVDSAFAWAAYNEYRNSSLNTNNAIDDNIFFLDKTLNDYIGAVEALKNDTALRSIYEGGISKEAIDKVQAALQSLEKDYKKKLEDWDTAKMELDASSFDKLFYSIQKITNSFNVVTKVERPTYSKDGVKLSDLERVKRRNAELEKIVKELKEVSEDKTPVIGTQDDSETVRELREKLFASDEKAEKLKKDCEALREKVKNSGGDLAKSISEALKNPESITDEKVKDFFTQFNELKKQNQGYRLQNDNLNNRIKELRDQLETDGAAVRMTLKNFKDMGLGPLFTNTKQKIREYAINQSFGEVGQRLELLMNAIYSRPQKGMKKQLDLKKSLDFRGVYSSDYSADADKYFEHAEALRKFVIENMLNATEQKYVGDVVKSIDNLTARQLVELYKHIAQVANDSRQYNIDRFKERKDYTEKWHKAIVSELVDYAISEGVDFTRFEEEDRVGIDSSKKTDFFAKLIDQFTLQSKRYRNIYPTLYSFIFGGGLDHRSKSSGFGLNEAQNRFYDGDTEIKDGKEVHRQGYTERANDLKKLIMKEFSHSIFYDGEITDKNFLNVFNLVKRSYRTVLGDTDLTDENRQSVGFKIEEFKQGKKTTHAASVDETMGSPAMREIVRYVGRKEAEAMDSQAEIAYKNDRIALNQKKLDNAQRKYDDAVSVISRLISQIETLTGLDTSEMNDEQLNKALKAVDTSLMTAENKKLFEDTSNVLSKTIEDRNKLGKSIEKVRKTINNAEDFIKSTNIVLNEAAKAGNTNPNTNKYNTQEILGIYLTVRQEGGIERLVAHPTELVSDRGSDLNAASSKTNNLTLGNIIWVVNEVENNPQYAPIKNVADEIVDIMSSSFDAIQQTKFILTDGKEIMQKRDYYFTFTVEPNSTVFDMPEVNLDFAQAKAEGKISSNAEANNSFTKKPTSEYAVSLDVLDTVFNQLYKQEYYVAFGEPINDLKNLLEDSRFQNALMKAEGRTNGRRMLDSLKDFTDGLGNAHIKPDKLALKSFTKFIVNNTAAGALAFSLPNVVMQYPTILVCLDDKNIGIGGLFKAIRRAWGDKDTVMTLSPQLKELQNSYVAMIRNSENVGTLLYKAGAKYGQDWMQNAGLKLERGIRGWQGIGLKALDHANVFAAKIMWYAYYEGVRKEKADLQKTLTKEEFDWMCANEATQRVMDITPTQQKKDNALIYNSNDSMVRQLILFTAQTDKMMNRYVATHYQREHEHWDWRKTAKNFGRLLAISATLWVTTALIKGTSYNSGDGDDKDEWFDKVLDIFSFVGDGIESEVPFISFLNDENYGGITQDIQSLLTAINKDEDKRTDHQLSNATVYTTNEVLGFITGGMENAYDRTYRLIRDIPEYGFRALPQIYNNNWAKIVEGL